MDAKHLGKRIRLVVAVVGLIAAIIGAGLGAYLGSEAPIAGGHVSAAIMAVIAGAWIGAAVVGGLGVWLAIKVFAMTAPHRRWFQFSLRTLFVMMLLCAIGEAQWMRVERLQQRAWEHKAKGVGFSVAAHTVHGEAFCPNARREAAKAYFQRVAEYHVAMAAKCRQSMWRPWIEFSLEPNKPAAGNSPAPPADQP